MMKEYNLHELGKRIKAARKAKKKTQDEVAEAIGVNKMTVSDWERGLKQPGFLNILNYCNVLGITLDELLEVKKPTYLNITFTEEERETMFSMLDACQREGENTCNLHLFKQHLNAFFSRAQRK